MSATAAAPHVGGRSPAHPRPVRALFVLPDLPRRSVSLRGIALGTEALSGTHASSLLVAELLASRGHEIGIYVRSGDAVTDTHAERFDALAPALAWVGDGRVVLCSWDEPDTMRELQRAGARPVIWLHVHVTRNMLHALEADEYDALVVVSDSIRLPLLRSPARGRIGRIYNPINPFFTSPVAAHPARYGSASVVCAGYFGETKGVHRLLMMWPLIRTARPDAVLSIAGSSRLYNDGRPVGSLGLAEPVFEEQYLQPLVRQFGSLAAAGVNPVGLLSPEGLRALYARSALGVLNLNWDSCTEACSCTGAEMLATELPVFGAAAGGLPETVGGSGGALLAPSADLTAAARRVVDLLGRPDRLAEMGRVGRAYVLDRQALQPIGDRWECLLRAPVNDLAAASGPWLGARSTRYWIEGTAGILGLGWLLDRVARWLKTAVSLRRGG